MDKNVLIRPFDDGLFIDFKKLIKPHQISFMCKTDVAIDAESCDFRLFEINKEKTLYNDVEHSWEQQEIIWS